MVTKGGGEGERDREREKGEKEMGERGGEIEHMKKTHCTCTAHQRPALTQAIIIFSKTINADSPH